MKKVTLIMIGILIYSIFNGNMQIMAKENKEVKTTEKTANEEIPEKLQPS